MPKGNALYPVGKQLRLCRQQAGLSQEALAVSAGLTREFISLVENGNSTISIDNLINLCVAMDIKASVFIKAIEDETEQSAE